ncbi:MAG: sigma-70 family RNA polymerase sigma factor [Proteobacteria bacterium]|nr:sigma-70 family RNA polymerase sigma factor [Pseudomonadota bacterium]
MGIDLKLVRRCQANDATAFGELVERYQRKVFTIALGMVKNPEDAMDIAQDAFIKVHRYIGNFQGTSSFYTWLYRIVFNLCIDHLRRSGKHINLDFDERIGNQDHLTHGSTVMANRLDTNPSKMLGRKELGVRISEAMDTLPPYHRTVIIMREIEGMSYSEMAKAMKVSKGTIMSRLHHARQKLKRALGEYLEGDMTVE